MASGYALPTAGAFQQHGHGHSHSYSGIHLTPNRPAQQNGFPKSNGHVRKAPSTGTLYTLGEVSRETSPNEPAVTQQDYRFPPPSFDLNTAAFDNNHHNSSHSHTRSHSHNPMKSNSRPRGESDLGRPAGTRAPYRPTLERLDSVPTASTSWFSLPEALTALLIPAPYLFASAAYSSMLDASPTGFPPLSAYNRPATASSLDASSLAAPSSSAFLETCILTASTMLLTGILAKLKGSERMTHRRGDSLGLSLNALREVSTWRTMTLRALGLGLPFYASMLLGGMRTGVVLLAAVAASLTCNSTHGGFNLHELKHGWSSKVATSVVIILGFICDELGLTLHIALADQMLGYMALAVSLLVLQPPLPLASPLGQSASSTSTSRRTVSGTFRSSTSSPLIQSTGDTHLTLFAGVFMSILTVLFSVILSTAPSLSIGTMILGTLAMASMSASIFFSQPALLRGQSKVGFAVGCFVTASCSFMFSPSLWPGTVCNGGLSALSFLGVLYDTHVSPLDSHSHQHDHDHDLHAHAGHAHQHHAHKRSHSEASSSRFTKFVMARFEPGSLVYSILSEKDSRRIAYFTTLNFIFMFVQGVYGYLSGSLGLLSDTVHMFFDCLGLIVGLGATVASKWPTSPEKPYGWGKLNTLAGFGNGVFLMLVSVEFVWEAVEGILEQRKLRHVTELLVVSTAGFLVNMVGLVAFGHAHAGHDHGHSHSHGHSYGKPHSHAHDHHSHDHHAHDLHEHEHHGHDHDHKANGHTHNHVLAHAHSHESLNHNHGHASPKASHDHAHHEHNDNMHGIFLHVAADAGGSLAVILSTAMNLWKPWYVWDPAATIVIAILIFAAAVPLVISSGQKLLLVIPDELEYSLKNTLQELGELRGVIGYANPRFWIDDKEDAGEAHGHHDGHDHGGSGGASKKVMGVIHIIASPIADLEDVRVRVEDFLLERHMDLVIDVEHEGARNGIA